MKKKLQSSRSKVKKDHPEFQLASSAERKSLKVIMPPGLTEN